MVWNGEIVISKCKKKIPGNFFLRLRFVAHILIMMQSFQKKKKGSVSDTADLDALSQILAAACNSNQVLPKVQTNRSLNQSLELFTTKTIYKVLSWKEILHVTLVTLSNFFLSISYIQCLYYWWEVFLCFIFFNDFQYQFFGHLISREKK